MELMYPIVTIICLVLSIIIYFGNFNKNKKYTNGKKVANTNYIKETEYYKAKVRRYNILSTLIKGFSVVCIIMVSLLVARPVTIQSKSEDKYNRDIIIGLDVSTSQCEVNLGLVKKFREIVPSIEGDRIGIVLYNTAPVVYCPLTEDYDYIKECLNTIEGQLDEVVKNNGYIPYSSNFDPEGNDTFTFWYGGTIANNEERGSSLVGDGLARYIVFIS